MTTAKKEVYYWVIAWKLLFRGDFTSVAKGSKTLLGRSLLGGGEFSRWGGMSKYLADGGTPPSSPVQKTMTLALFFCFLVPFYYDFMLIYFIRMTIWEILLSSNWGIKSYVLMQFLAEISHRLFKDIFPVTN